MDSMQIRLLFKEAGIDYDTALRRMMGKESLYYRFLKKFLEDENYAMLVKAAGQGDGDGAFRAAHTLKGLCGNLGMDRLLAAVSKTVEKLRSHQAETLPQDFLKDELLEVTRAYDEVVQAISQAQI